MSSMYIFTRKWGSPICMFCWLHKALIGRRSYSSTTRVIYWSSIHSNKRYGHLLGLDKISSVGYDSGETQTCNSWQKYWSKIPTDMNVLIWAKSIKHFNTISPRHICKISRSMYADAPRGKAQFVLKIEKFSHIIGAPQYLKWRAPTVSVPDYSSR